uniref:Uncharacterized protein n=1 Tax=Alexandrium monilatum TaxID=311494 RepID=A0A7S4PZM0_9DINO
MAPGAASAADPAQGTPAGVAAQGGTTVAEAAVYLAVRGQVAELRAELQQARDEISERGRHAGLAEARLAEQEEERFRAAQELGAARRALEVREAEVKELQLIGKYFAGRETPPTPPEFSAAELAEELRVRCARLSEEAQQLRMERDLLRAERNHAVRAEHTDRYAGGFGTGGSGMLASDAVAGRLGQRLFDQRFAAQVRTAVPMLSHVPAGVA